MIDHELKWRRKAIFSFWSNRDTETKENQSAQATVGSELLGVNNYLFSHRHYLFSSPAIILTGLPLKLVQITLPFSAVPPGNRHMIPRALSYVSIKRRLL